MSFWPFSINNDYLWDLNLAQSIPIDLVVDTGVGTVDLDLREIMLSNLNIDVGVGSTTVDLPNTGDYSVEIDGGVGSLIVTVPEGFDAKVRAEVGVGGVSVPNGFTAFGDERWETDGFDSASERVDISVDGGVGMVNGARSGLILAGSPIPSEPSNSRFRRENSSSVTIERSLGRSNPTPSTCTTRPGLSLSTITRSAR